MHAMNTLCPVIQGVVHLTFLGQRRVHVDDAAAALLDVRKILARGVGKAWAETVYHEESLLIVELEKDGVVAASAGF